MSVSELSLSLSESLSAVPEELSLSESESESLLELLELLLAESEAAAWSSLAESGCSSSDWKSSGLARNLSHRSIHRLSSI